MQNIQFRNNNKEIFSSLKEKWIIATPEEIVRQKFICHLVDKYGYSLNQMDQEIGVKNLQTDNDRVRVDIVIWKSNQDKENKKLPLIVVDCHATNRIKNEDYLQVENYALLAGVKFFVTYFEADNKKEQRIFKFSEEKPPLQIVELEDMPHADILDDEVAIQELLGKTKSVSRDEFKKVFFACHDAIRNNDKLSPEMAFDEISKILFIKIKYEKENSIIFSRDVFQNLNTPYQKLFNETKEKYKYDGIFEENDTLRIRELTFLQILDKLSQYNLAEIPEDIKGVAFEEFLGKTFRGDLGQFFTPRTLVNFMVDILDPQEGELVADPCCGSGGFLIKAFDHIKSNIKNSIRAEKNRLRNEYKKSNFDSLSVEEQNLINSTLISKFKDLEKDLNNSIEGTRLYHLSNYCIYGTDAEPRSARTAKMNMIMQGDGHSGVHHHDGLLNINGIFENRFDVILTNPPFGSRISKDLIIRESDILPDSEADSKYKAKYGASYLEAQNTTIERYNTIKEKLQLKIKDKNKEAEVPLLSFFEIGDSTLTEVVFVERCLKLLRKGGRMGIVLPEGFLNGTDLQKVREYVESKAKILLIVSVPQDVFISAGASVKSSLVFLKKFTEDEEIRYKNIVEKATANINLVYEKGLENLSIQIKNAKGDDKKDLIKQEKELLSKIQKEIKIETKIQFDYDVPIVQVEKAGISSTGQEIDNDLNDVKIEFAPYRIQKQLWENEKLKNINF